MFTANRKCRGVRGLLTTAAALCALFLMFSGASGAPAGGAVSVDGSGDYILIQDDPSLQFGEVDGVGPDFTIEGWFYTTSISEQHLIRKGDYASYAATTNYCLRFEKVVCCSSTTMR